MLFLIVTVIFSLAGLAVAWYISNEVNVQAITMGHQVAYAMGSNSSQYDLVETFLTNVTFYLPVLALIGVALWAWVYSQRKGERVFV